LDRLGRLSWRPLSCLGKQLSSGRREPDERAALVHHEPAAFDRELHAGAVLRGIRRLRKRDVPRVCHFFRDYRNGMQSRALGSKIVLGAV
jgi:hypothetical protein